MDALEAIAQRRSVRNYSPEPVPVELIEKTVDAARRAPTARNVQPWEFVVITDPQVRARLAEICEYGRFIAESPVCIATFCHDTKYYLEDGCAAIENMLVAATALGLGTCWVAGDKKEYAGTIAQELGVPNSHRLIGLVAMGYAANSAGPTKKRPLKEVLHTENW
ncbi:MAG: nitroreductase family protein [Planctomycetes bacterium]|jgi:nitroreductase|nr:nitroreductase family protein [Planctomycetota bacterium]